MTVRAFVSSTKEDLKDDCRPAVIKAIRSENGEAVEMDGWDAGHEPVLALCRDKLSDSTHYVGVFAFRYGWMPPGLGKSITELEYDLARDSLEPHDMVIFLPDEEKSFAAALEDRASSQGPDDAARQKAFRDRITQGRACQFFEDPVDLTLRVVRRVKSWQQGGLRNAARTGRDSRTRRPSRSDIVRLGRAMQQLAFRQTLDWLSANDPSVPVAFLIHGPRGFGQSELADRLVAEPLSTRPPKRCLSTVNVRWRQQGPARLIEVLARESGARGADLDALAGALVPILETNDVLLDVRDAHRLHGGLAALHEAVWAPLVEVLPAGTTYRVVMLATSASPMEAVLPVQSPLPPDAQPPFDPKRVVALPALGPLLAPELSGWLRTWLPPDDALALAQVIIDETDGQPQAVFAELGRDSNWQE